MPQQRLTTRPNMRTPAPAPSPSTGLPASDRTSPLQQPQRAQATSSSPTRAASTPLPPAPIAPTPRASGPAPSSPPPAAATPPAPAPAATGAGTPAPAPAGQGGGTGMVGPVTTGINRGQETIEGRLDNLLATDQNGNYTHPLMRQAMDRQNQAFAARGIRNSSMAMQAGQEAVISKGIDIAAPDAQRYFENRRANLDARNDFRQDRNDRAHDRWRQNDQQAQDRWRQNDQQDHEMERDEQTRIQEARRDYTTYINNINTNFQRQVDTINASNMTPEEKTQAIRELEIARDGEIAFANDLYADMPGWERDWLAEAVDIGDGVSGPTMDVDRITNIDTLANIANDPAQPPEVRQQAAQRIQELRRDGGGDTGGDDGTGGSPGGNSGTADNGYTFPNTVSGIGNVNWDARDMLGRTLKQQYEQYATSQGGSALSPGDWLKQIRGPSPAGGASDSAPAAAASSNDGGSVGISI